MFNNENAYLDLLWYVRWNGEYADDRTGTGVLTTFAPTSEKPLKFSLANNTLPIITTKKVPWKSVVAETLWFTQGRVDLKSLREDGCTWWDEWELPDGTIGRGYGAQLRHWMRPDGTEYDQLAYTIDQLKNNPRSRRHVMTMWNAGELDEMALPPCHGVAIQFYVHPQHNLLSSFVHIRSSDLFLGLPTNIPSYALLTILVAQVVGMSPHTLTITLGDAHIYSNHINQVDELLSREVIDDSPKVILDPTINNIDEFKPEHITLDGYYPQSKIYAPVAV